MSAGLILDAITVVILAVALVAGLSRGILRTLGAIAGLAAGGAGALVVMPIVSNAVPAAGWNVAAAIAAGLGLVALGIGIGSAIGRAIRKPVRRIKLGAVDRLLGGAAGLAMGAATVLVFAMSASSFGVPFLSQAVASSSVLRLVQDATPDSVESSLARLRSLAIDDGIPTVLDAAGIEHVTVPDVDTDSPELRAASDSVLRVTTYAPLCSSASSGSGFVISEELAMTNAHVVAGAREIVVEPPGDLPRAASVVYFDPGNDIAVLSVPGLGTAPLPFSVDPSAGEPVFFQGYPYGGPFVSRSASVLGTGPLSVADIYQGGPVTRSVTTLAGVVQPGNSGGPLLTADGAVAGMIFARSDAVPNVGFALAMEELAPVLALASGLADPVSTGACA